MASEMDKQIEKENRKKKNDDKKLKSADAGT